MKSAGSFLFLKLTVKENFLFFFKKPEPDEPHGPLILRYLREKLDAKEELWKLKYFTPQTYDLQKIL